MGRSVALFSYSAHAGPGTRYHPNACCYMRAVPPITACCLLVLLSLSLQAVKIVYYYRVRAHICMLIGLSACLCLSVLNCACLQIGAGLLVGLGRPVCSSACLTVLSNLMVVQSAGSFMSAGLPVCSSAYLLVCRSACT